MAEDYLSHTCGKISSVFDPSLGLGLYFLAAGVLRRLHFKIFGRIQFHEFFDILRTKITGTLQKLATLPD